MAQKDHAIGSGNVFEDLGRPRPAEALAKAELARKVAELIAERQLTQEDAAARLEIDHRKVSDLARGRLAGFSRDRLVRFLVLLGGDGEIAVTPRTREADAACVRARIEQGWQESERDDVVSDAEARGHFQRRLAGHRTRP